MCKGPRDFVKGVSQRPALSTNVSLNPLLGCFVHMILIYLQEKSSLKHFDWYLSSCENSCHHKSKIDHITQVKTHPLYRGFMKPLELCKAPSGKELCEAPRSFIKSLLYRGFVKPPPYV